jgi:[calcium/calmodulin-dependent protein kinase] kinase
VHRDIKPSNLLLTSQCSNGILKLADFGVSEQLDQDGLVRKWSGSAAFMSPELGSLQARGGSIDGRKADIWAMGITLYCFLYGYIPFKGNSVAEMYDHIINANLETPAHENVDDEARNLLYGLLQKVPSQRFTLDMIRKHPWLNAKY